MSAQHTSGPLWSVNPRCVTVYVGDRPYEVNTETQTAVKGIYRRGAWIWQRVPFAQMSASFGLNLVLAAEDRLRLMEEENRAAIAKATGSDS